MFQLIQKLAAPLIAGYENHRVRFQCPLGRFFICLDEKIVVGADRGRIGFHLINVLVFRQCLFLALDQAVQPLQKRRSFRRAGALPDELLQNRPRQGWIHPQGADLLGLDLLPVIRGKISVDKPRLIQPIQQIHHIVHEPLRGVQQFCRWRILCLDQPIKPCQHGSGFHYVSMLGKIVQWLTDSLKIARPHFRHKVGNGLLPGVQGKGALQNAPLVERGHQIV